MRRPATREALEKIPGITPQVLRRLGDAIDAALRSVQCPAPGEMM